MTIKFGEYHKNRTPIDISHVWTYKNTRAEYVRIIKNMGFYDICECDITESDRHNRTSMRYREGTGTPGQLECIKCFDLVYTHCHIYPCDECTEPTLVNEFPYSQSKPLLCIECAKD